VSPRIYLVRHGETELNATRVLQPPATPLSAHGLAQAERVAARLAGAGLLRVWVSDLRRAEMTAEAIARASGAPLLRDPDLAERNFGALRGRPYAELGLDPFAPGYAPPEGESWEVFHARVDRVWQRVDAAARAAGGPIAVVTHGLVCRAVVSRRAVLAPGLSLDGRGWRNTSVTVLDADPAWRVTLLDDVSHLDEVREGGVA
jgi:2,3-bisphosphoglycerate-dependent phosphoglycerate mutase